MKIGRRDDDTVETLSQPPGSRHSKALHRMKGRQPDPTTIKEIGKILGKGKKKRDNLIEYIHQIQDFYDFVPLELLVALAAEMKISQAEVYEVATFYDAFDVQDKSADEARSPQVRICNSLSCKLAGAETLTKELKQHFGDQISVVSAPCMGRCDAAPVTSIGNNYITRSTLGSIEQSILKKEVKSDTIRPVTTFQKYKQSGGYSLLGKCKSGEVTFDDIVECLDAAGLRGLGGAGFPTGKKLRSVRNEVEPRLMVVNADESEPGTFKDRWYLERDPHRFIEGMLIAACAIQAEKIYIYLRNEYPQILNLLVTEIQNVKNANLVSTPIEIRRGAGAYICGEESAMLESIEGKRGLPRHKPPFPSQCGLFGKPTLINNVETLYWFRNIIEDPASLRSKGSNSEIGLRSFSVSGRVSQPGVKLAPAGITVRSLVDEYCGGMLNGSRLGAYLPGGASGGIFPASMCDIPLDFGAFEKYGGFIGSAAIIVLSEEDNIPDTLVNLLEFFRHESCGQCSPCRLGTEKAVSIMESNHWDLDTLGDLAEVMADSSICGLGQAAANPINCAINYFKGDLP